MSTQPALAQVTTTPSTVVVTAAMGSAGQAVPATNSAKVRLRNPTLSGPVKYKVGAGDWTLLDVESGVELEINLSTTAVLVRKASTSATSVSLAVEVDVVGGVGVGASVEGGGNTVKTLPTFAFEPQSAANFARMAALGAAPNENRKISHNRLIARLKACGSFYRMTGLYVTAADSQAQCVVNLRNPGKYDLTVGGTPAFTQFKGATFPTIADFYDTGIPLTQTLQNDVSMGVFTRPTYSATQIAALMGSSDASGTKGLQILATTSKKPFVGVQSASNSSNGAVTGTDGDGLTAINRRNSTGYDLWRNSSLTDSFVAASIAPDIATTIRLGQVNGRTITCNQPISAAWVGRSLTDEQMRITYAAIRDYLDKVEYGDMEIHEAGYGPAVVKADHICYGATLQSIDHATNLARQGHNVIIVGGWRERSPGGMSANGLGYVDIDNLAAIGGTIRSIITRIRVGMMGVSDTAAQFPPRFMTYAIRELLDGNRAGGRTIPIYWSDGVVSVNEAEQSFTTADGRTFIGKTFEDNSYEFDLGRVAQASMMPVGRQAAGTGAELYNGYRGLQTTGGGSSHQFVNQAGALINISPYVVDGDPNSGLLPGIKEPTIKTVGQADGEIQAFNFRWTATNGTAHAVKNSFPMPAGYNASTYELLGRQFAADPTLNIARMLSFGGVGLNTFDVNNQGGFSQDLMDGSATAYVNATTYAAREIIWKKHESYQRGLYYYLSADPDTRVPAALRASFNGYAFDDLHYLDPHPNDQLHWMGQLYIRSFQQIIGLSYIDGNDLKMTDGTAPRDPETIGTITYTQDVHHMERLVDRSTTPHRVWNSGNVQNSSGGTDLISPVPRGVTLPVSCKLKNFSTSWSVYMSNVAFGGYRMEHGSSTVAEGTAAMAALAVELGIEKKDVPYALVRPRMLSNPDNTVPCVLPLVN